jgi:hypothetical protein
VKLQQQQAVAAGAGARSRHHHRTGPAEASTATPALVPPSTAALPPTLAVGRAPSWTHEQPCPVRAF